MNLKDKLIIEEYENSRDDFLKLGDTVHELMADAIEEADLHIMEIQHRVKTEKSLAGKLERKGDRYNSLDDLTDILGCRIICFFDDEVDKIGKIVEDLFVIDWENSVDKRATLRPDAFGYLSLHYICSLEKGKGYPDEICGRKFEIQIRTVLQHAWAAINHDLGYKSDFGVPATVTRDFSRIAGLLELADDEFVRTRNKVHDYTADIRERIKNDCADDVAVDSVSLDEYISHSRQMISFIEDLASICGAEISWIDPESYLPLLKWFGIEKLGDLREMLEDDRDLAYALAKRTLENSDLDILSSNVGLRFLCRAELINKGYSYDKAVQFFRLQTRDDARANRQAKFLYDSINKMNGADDGK